jgi:hypothetical protein
MPLLLRSLSNLNKAGDHARCDLRYLRTSFADCIPYMGEPPHLFRRGGAGSAPARG